MNAIAIFITLIALFFQSHYFWNVWKNRKRFNDFFVKNEEYATFQEEANGEEITKLKQVAPEESDLNTLIEEINHYVAKTKGTTDFAVIQNKVERKLNMRYEQSSARISFPTYIGLMGTFAGVFYGVWTFLGNFDNTGITDESIKNLLNGVLISMFTSFLGLLLTTINYHNTSKARKNIEEDKNVFYDFIQTELMPSLDVSMVLAVTRLHETVDKFEPAFDRVISHFQTTFDNCTKAFGDSFETSVRAVADAVDRMGRNMGKINENISLQQQLLIILKSKDLVKGMDKYIEASERFSVITQSLDKFEETRQAMLAAAQETINMQNSYSETLKVPREIAAHCNLILDRITKFEENVNRVGKSLDNRQILGNDVIESIREQINQIRKKEKVADRYFEIADDKLNKLFEEQTKTIDQLNNRYTKAIIDHAEEFEKMLESQRDELKTRHDAFLEEARAVVNIEEIHKDFSNLRKLNEILELTKKMSSELIKPNELYKQLQNIKEEVAKIETSKPRSGNVIGNLFSRNSSDYTEISKLKEENMRLQGNVEYLRREVNKLITEKQATPSRTTNTPATPTITAPESAKSEMNNTTEEKKKPWSFFSRKN